jgi:hypothetical protein
MIHIDDVSNLVIKLTILEFGLNDFGHAMYGNVAKDFCAFKIIMTWTKPG